MKSVYSKLFTVILLAVNFPRMASAQCMCSGGVPATPVTYVATLSPTTAATSTISFPKFPPATGNLSCVGFVDSVTVISQTNVTNTATDSVDYKFNLAVNVDLEGPGGISTGPSMNIIYYDTLAPGGSPGDATINGPDSVFVSAPDSTGTGSTAAFLGTTGTADFTYSIDGGLTVSHGGTNYADTVKTVYSGSFRLTYYWCPNVVEATTITNFTAVPNGSAIALQWLSSNQQPNTTYEIQVSTDGKNFQNLGSAEGNASSAGTSTEYQYQYNPDQANVGKLYFRVEEVGPNGAISYSQVVVYDPSGSGAAEEISYQTFPNPATNSLLFQFNSNQTGNFLLQLVNTAGQIVQQKAVTLAEGSQIRLDLTPQPAKGLYFLRTVDLTHNHNYVSKVFIN